MKRTPETRPLLWLERKNAIFHKNAHKSILLLLSGVQRKRKKKKKCCPHLQIISAMNYLTDWWFGWCISLAMH
jgi:hypothetical protein